MQLSARQQWALAIVLGGALGQFGDFLHMTFGVLWYPQPFIGGQAVWVFPLFASATAVLLVAVDPVRHVLHGAVPRSSLKDAVTSTLEFFAAYAFTAVCGQWPNTVLAVLTAVWLARLTRLPAWMAGYSAGVAVVGVAFEAVLSRAGGFYYSHPDFVGVPRWLPSLYLLAALAAPRIRAVLAKGHK